MQLSEYSSRTDGHNLLSNCVQSSPFNDVGFRVEMDLYDYERCETFQDLADLMTMEDSLMNHDDEIPIGIPRDDQEMSVNDDHTANNSFNSPELGLVETSYQFTKESSSEQSYPPDVVSEEGCDIAKEKRRQQRNKKAREKRRARKQEKENRQDKAKIWEEKKLKLLNDVSIIKKEIFELGVTNPNIVCQRLCQISEEQCRDNGKDYDNAIAVYIEILEHLRTLDSKCVDNIVRKVCQTQQMASRNM